MTSTIYENYNIYIESKYIGGVLIKKAGYRGLLEYFNKFHSPLLDILFSRESLSYQATIVL